jgi:hypothetical protein
MVCGIAAGGGFVLSCDEERSENLKLQIFNLKLTLKCNSQILFYGDVTMIRIKFKTEADEARGFYELLTRASGESLQGGIYWVEESTLTILNEAGISYEILPNGERRVHETSTLRDSLATNV